MTSLPLPVHGFVLAGGRSLRMGEDKALMTVGGRPMVQVAVEKLRRFCAEVSIAGSREDLRSIAPVVADRRTQQGPTAGLEAALAASQQTWAMFIPVDVPLVPGRLLQRWAAVVVSQQDNTCEGSVLAVEGVRQPAFCMLHRGCLPTVQAALERGERRLNGVLDSIGVAAGGLWVFDAARATAGPVEATLLERWFLNVNTPEDLREAEAWWAYRQAHLNDQQPE